MFILFFSLGPCNSCIKLQKQSQEKIEVVMEEKEEALRKTEQSHHAVIEDIKKEHQQVPVDKLPNSKT